MGAIGGLVGIGGGAAGTSFNGPGGVGMQNPVEGGQLQSSYGDIQNSMQSQMALRNALQAQNGLGNQSQVYNQLQGVVNGTGPNPAQAQLAQATGQNVANQAALMAGQRGAGANVGLMARQAAMQGANTQQNAIGQAASLQAQQSLNALTGAGNIANTQVGNQIAQTNAYNQAQQSEQQQLLAAQGNFNNAQVGMQSNVNSVNGQLANTQMQGQQSLVGGVMNGVGALMGASGGMVNNYDEGGDVEEGPAIDAGSPSDASVGAAPNTSVPTFGSDAGAAALGPQKSGGGGGGGIMSMLPMLAMAAEGGEVPSMPSSGPVAATPASGPSSAFGKFLKGATKKPNQIQNQDSVNFGNPGSNALYQGASNMFGAIGKSLKGSPNASASAPGEVADASNNYATSANNYGTGQQAPGNFGAAPLTMGQDQFGGAPSAPSLGVDTSFYKGGMTHNYVGGGKVKAARPQEKAVKGGNSYSNDKIPAVLSEHEIVLPRSVTLSKDPVGGAARFVAAVMAKKRAGK